MGNNKESWEGALQVNLQVSQARPVKLDAKFFSSEADQNY